MPQACRVVGGCRWSVVAVTSEETVFRIRCPLRFSPRPAEFGLGEQQSWATSHPQTVHSARQPAVHSGVVLEMDRLAGSRASHQ